MIGLRVFFFFGFVSAEDFISQRGLGTKNYRAFCAVAIVLRIFWRNIKNSGTAPRLEDEEKKKLTFRSRYE